VIEQSLNLFKTGVVQRKRVETFKAVKKGTADPDFPYTTPRIHACVFDPKLGDLVRLDVDFKGYIDELSNIYDLYSVGDEDEENIVAPKELPVEATEKVVVTELPLPWWQKVLAMADVKLYTS
jgi:hypothetical protein